LAWRWLENIWKKGARMHVFMAEKSSADVALDAALARSWSGLKKALWLASEPSARDPSPTWGAKVALSKVAIQEQALLGWELCEQAAEQAPRETFSPMSRAQESAGEAMKALAELGFFKEALAAVEDHAALGGKLGPGPALAALCQAREGAGPWSLGEQFQALSDSKAWEAPLETGADMFAGRTVRRINVERWARPLARLGAWSSLARDEGERRACALLTRRLLAGGQFGEPRASEFSEQVVAGLSCLAPPDVAVEFWDELPLRIKAGLAVVASSVLGERCFGRLAAQMSTMDGNGRDEAGCEMSLRAWGRFNQEGVERLRSRCAPDFERWLAQALKSPTVDGLWGMKAEMALRFPSSAWAKDLLGLGAEDQQGRVAVSGRGRDWAPFFERLRCAMDERDLRSHLTAPGMKSPRSGL
jgi:hypothetical protein